MSAKLKGRHNYRTSMEWRTRQQPKRGDLAPLNKMDPLSPSYQKAGLPVFLASAFNQGVWDKQTAPQQQHRWSYHKNSTISSSIDQNTETTVAATQLYSHLNAKVRIKSHQVEFNWCYWFKIKDLPSRNPLQCISPSFSGVGGTELHSDSKQNVWSVVIVWCVYYENCECRL